MAQITVPKMDFSTLGELPNVWKAARLETNRKESLAALGQGASPQEVAIKLFQIGDVQGGLSLANLANAMEQQKFNREQALHSRGISERQIGLQERQAQDKPTLIPSEGPSGEKVIYRVTPDGRSTVVRPEGAETQPANPFLTGKPGTEGQQNAQLLANRMLGAEGVLRETEAVATDSKERLKGWASDKIGYNIRGPEFQKFDQARRDFINATLRRESGAVINDAEFDNANKQYFPMPGDTPEVIQQKRRNRIEAIKGIGAAGGPGYRPSTTIDASGNLVPNQPAQAKPKLPAGYTPDRALAEAKTAIAAGKDRNAVVQRLQQLGIDASGL